MTSGGHVTSGGNVTSGEHVTTAARASPDNEVTVVLGHYTDRLRYVPHENHERCSAPCTTTRTRWWCPSTSFAGLAAELAGLAAGAAALPSAAAPVASPERPLTPPPEPPAMGAAPPSASADCSASELVSSTSTALLTWWVTRETQVGLR